MVYGTSVEEVLQDTVLHGGRLRWKFPDRPALCSLKIPFDLESPHPNKGFNNGMKSMLSLLGISSNVSLRHVRTGAARDLAHLPNQSSDRTVAKAVAMQLGHKHTSFNSGVTEVYAGHPEQYFFNDRVKADHFDVLGPKPILSPQPPQSGRKASSADISAYCVKQDWDPADNLARDRASKHLKQERTDQRTQTGKDPSLTTEARNEEASAKLLATIQSAIQAFFASQSVEASPSSLGFGGAGSLSTPASPEETNADIDDSPTAPIDPNSDEYRDFALDVALDDDLADKNSSLPSANASHFVTWLSRINTVKSSTPTVLPHPRHMPCDGSSKDLPSYFSATPASTPSTAVSEDPPFSWDPDGSDAVLQPSASLVPGLRLHFAPWVLRCRRATS